MEESDSTHSGSFCDAAWLLLPTVTTGDAGFLASTVATGNVEADVSFVTTGNDSLGIILVNTGSGVGTFTCVVFGVCWDAFGDESTGSVFAIWGSIVSISSTCHASGVFTSSALTCISKFPWMPVPFHNFSSRQFSSLSGIPVPQILS